MGFEIPQVVAAFEYVGIDRMEGQDYELEAEYMGDVTARLFGEAWCTDSSHAWRWRKRLKSSVSANSFSKDFSEHIITRTIYASFFIPAEDNDNDMTLVN